MNIEFSYKDVPTLRDANACKDFVIGILGPFGCLSHDTEFLTETGWKKICEYVEGDLVAQWDSHSQKIEYVKPKRWVKLPSEELIAFHNRHSKMLLSPEHRVPHYKWDGEFQVKQAHEIEKKPSRREIPTTFEASGPGLGLSENIIRFAVMMHADGHYAKNSKKAVLTFRKSHKIERAKFILDSLNVEYTTKTYPNRPTEVIFSFYPPYRGKHFDDMWWCATNEEMKIIIDEVWRWDGGTYPEKRYFTTCKKCADYIQYVSHATGNRATICKQESEKKNWKTNYVVHFKSNGAKNKYFIRENTEIFRVTNDHGYKYCFEVESSFFLARYDNNIFVTGNSGKSSACIWTLFERALEQEPGPDGIRRSRWAIIRNSYPELRDTTMRTVFEWLPPERFGEYVKSDRSYRITRIPGVEIEFIFLALDKPKDIGKLLSLELTGAWVNEAREIPWTIIQALQGRVGRFPRRIDGGCTWSGIIMDTNPPDEDSWWYRQFEEKRPQGWKLFRQPSGLSDIAENLNHLPKDYYTRLKQGMDDEKAKVYVEGKYGFIVEGKPVYPGYDDGMHVSDIIAPIKDKPIYRGWDFGLTPACVFTQVLPSGQFIIFDELFAEEMGAERFSDDVLLHCNMDYKGFNFEDYGDPAGRTRAQSDEKTCFEILQSKGIKIDTGEQSLQLRIEAVKKPLHTFTNRKPQLQLHPRCRILRKGFQGGYKYRRMQTSQEKYSEQPDKNIYSHCFVAGTPVLTPKGEVPIDKLQIGDYVTTPKGPRMVRSVMSSFTSDLVDVALSNGKFIRCTPDHPFYTEKGVRRVDALQYFDILVSWEGHPRTDHKNITALDIIENAKDIMHRTIVSMGDLDTCTETYGNTVTVKYLTGITYTIKTVIKPIIQSRIWNWLKPDTTVLCMAKNGHLKTRKQLENKLLSRGVLQGSGMGQRREESGIAITPSEYGSSERPMITFAKYATNLFNHVRRRMSDFVNPPVSQSGAEIQESTMKLGNVANVPKDLPSANTVKQNSVLKVVGIQAVQTPRTKVYDLTVDDAHCFYVQGALVSNCHDALQYVATRLFGDSLTTNRKQVNNFNKPLKYDNRYIV